MCAEFCNLSLMNIYIMRFIALFLSSVFLLACSSSESGEDPRVDMSTYDVIQTQIWDKNCVSCHQEGTTFAKQSNLVLTAGESYEQLVGQPPHNTFAKDDGLIRVGNEGLRSIYDSYLWEKINWPDYAHYRDDHPEYGALMPQGGQALTNGELRYITEWIVAGAPRDGQVADIALLDDTDRFEIPVGEFALLTPPEQGEQLNIGPFDILPGTEREFLFFQPLDNSEEIYINRIETTMREGSHHLIIYDFPLGNRPEPGVIRDYYNEDGSFNALTVASVLNQRFVAGTQLKDSDYHFPEGVALRIPTDAGFDLNSHYVNRTDEVKAGEVSINLHTVPKSEVRHVARNIFESYQDFRLPPQEVTTVERQSIFDERMNIFQLTSHAHQFMEEFEIYLVGGPRDGELVYFTNDWEHPPLLSFDPPIVLEPGQGLRSVATYNNTTDRTLRFGLLSEDEMMIVFGAFYTD